MDNVRCTSICTWTENWVEEEDITTNILSRLPVKPLLICKSVSKGWRRLICSPDFVLSQLRWSRENPSFIFFLRYENELIKISGEVFERIPLPFGQRPNNCDMICSFNGFICLTNYIGRNHNILIWNPATQEVQLLPTTTLSKKPPKIGVAYGPGTYKLFRIFYPASKSQPGYCECEVYSSITRSWKGIGSVTYWPMSSKHVSINETVYWFISAEKDRTVAGSILAVDLEENFRKISLPEEVSRNLSLVDLEGCLSLISIHVEANRFDIWVLQDYKNEAIWFRKCSEDMPILEIGYVFSVVAQKNEILFMLVERYFLYNIGSRTWRELDWGDVLRRMYPTAFAFTESLLPCKSQNWF